MGIIKSTAAKLSGKQPKVPPSVAAREAARPQQTKNLPAKAAGTEVGAVGSWEDALAKYAKRSAKVAEAMGTTGNWLTFKGGILSYKGLPLKDNQIELVILDEVLENVFYEGRFDPDTPASPVCFALARELGDLKPHETSPDPQHETCKGCPQNEFGTSETGKGKACKNIVRLAAIAWGDGSREQLESCELAFAKLPVTSTKGWAAYTKALNEKYNSPPFGAVTRMYVEPDAKSQFKVCFELVERLDRKLGQVVLKRVIEADREIIPAQPYQPIEREERAAPPPRGARGKAAPARRAKY